jgi:hypothetical protein
MSTDQKPSFDFSAEKLPKFNHYVPKFILKGFCQNGKLCVFDKHTSKEFKLPPERAMGENNYTNVTFNDAILSFENRFTYLENLAAPVIKKIVEQRKLQVLEPEELASLHMFVLVQYLRSKRRMLDHDVLTDAIRDRWPDAEINPWKGDISDKELTKFMGLRFAFEHIDELTKHLLVKHAYLMVRDCKDELYISDSPLVMHNQKTFGPYGNIGVGVPHIEIYYPLSAEVVLAYACHQTMQEIEAEQEKKDQQISSFIGRKILSSGLSPADLSNIARDKEEMRRARVFYSMMKNDRVVPMDAANVLFLNSLQVSTSYRYLAARKPHFHFAKKALSERPHWREGLSLRVA